VHPGGGLAFDFGAAGPRSRVTVDELGLYSPMVDSISALSRASPTLPMDPAIPASSSASVNAIEVYWVESIGRRNTLRSG
jgi:hypothetical protein